MELPLTRDITDRNAWKVNPKGLWNVAQGKVVPAKANEVAVDLERAPLEGLVSKLGTARGLWLNGAITEATLGALQSLPALVELHVRSTGLTAELLQGLAQLPRLERLRLVAVDPAALGGLKTLKVPALSVNLRTVAASEATAAGLTTLLGLPLTELRIKCEPGPQVPNEAVDAFVGAATVRTLFIEGLAFSAPQLSRLLGTRSLETATLNNYGAPGEVAVDKAPALRRLELLGTNISTTRLSSLPLLEYLQVHHAKQLTLSQLPVLRELRLPTFTQSLTIELTELPALEAIDATSSALDHLTLSGVPALRHVDLRGLTVNAQVLDALKATKAELALGP